MRTRRSSRLRSLLAASLVAPFLVPLAASPALALANGEINGVVLEPGTATRPPFFLGDICVDAFRAGEWVAREVTNANTDPTGQEGGYYEFNSLDAGAYKLRYTDCGSQRTPSTAPNNNFATLPEQGYSGGWYGGSGLAVKSADEALEIVVTPDNATRTAVSTSAGDITLVPDSTITGVVSQDSPPNALGSVCVQAYDADTGNLVREVRTSDGSTATLGAYTIPGLFSGRYKVLFRDDIANCGDRDRLAGYTAVLSDIAASQLLTHESEWWTSGGGAPGGIANGEAFEITDNSTSPFSIDGSLPAINNNQGISGTVQQVGGGAATPVCVSAYASAGSTEFRQAVATNASGAYSIPLPAGSYYVEVHERCVKGTAVGSHTYVGEVHPDVFYDDDAAPTSLTPTLNSFVNPPASALVSVSSGVFTTVNPTISRRGSIAGTVTDSADPTSPIAGVCVVALEGTLALNTPYVPNAVTDEFGNYTITGLRPADNYIVRFLPQDADASGNCPGDQLVDGDDEDTLVDYLDEYYADANSRAGATTVSVTSGQARTGISATLRGVSTFYTMSGRATLDGTAANGVCISILNRDGDQVNLGADPAQVLTGADGTWTIGETDTDGNVTSGVPEGSYLVRASRSGDCSGGADSSPGSRQYVATQYHPATYRVADAAAVNVSSNRTGLDMALQLGSRLTGDISIAGRTDSTEAPVGTTDRACVEVLTSTQSVLRSSIHALTSEAPLATFTFEGVPSGTYFLSGDDDGSGTTCGGASFTGTDAFVKEYYLRQTTFQNATPIAFPSGQGIVESGKDIILNTVEGTPGSTARLWGFVRDPDFDGTGSDTEQPLNNIRVEAFTFDQDPGLDQPVAFAVTGPKTFDRPYTDCPDSQFDRPDTSACETDLMGETTDPITLNDPITIEGYWELADLSPGSYRIRFRDPQGVHATEWYRSNTTFDSALAIKVDVGSDIQVGEFERDYDNYDSDRRANSNVSDAGNNTDPESPTVSPCVERCNELMTRLNPAGNVAGRVTAEDTGAALPGTRVDLLETETGSIVTSAFADSDGRYQMPGVAAGLYKVLFTPTDPNYTGEFFEERDSFGSADLVAVASSSSTSNVNATLVANNAPVAGDDNVQAEINETTKFTGLLGNDVDAEGDVLTIVEVTQPDVHGSVTITDEGRSITFVPETDNQADTTFTYTISDRPGLTSTATVRVNMVGEIVGFPPIANDDEVTTPRDQSVVVNVLANDSDPDGNFADLEVVSVTTPFHGAAVINANNTVTYTPEAGFSGPDQFAYTVRDSQGFESSARVSVGVNAATSTGADDTVEGGDTVGTEGTTATPDNRIITTVTSPNPGTVTIRESEVDERTDANGTTFIEVRADIEAPNASPANPLVITFRIDGSVLNGKLQPQRSLRVLRNGAAIGDCLGFTVADPDPCITSHRMIGDDVFIKVNTSQASLWTFAFLDQAVVDRAAIQGRDRVDTAVRVSRQAFTPAEVDTVVIARSDTYPDALAGAPLAHQVGGPLLLTNSQALNAVTRDEIQRLGASRVIILGGPNAVSDGVQSTIASIPGVTQVERISGRNRYETAAKIADQLTSGHVSAYVVEGANADPNRGWPDAVSVASLAAWQGRPILLVTRDTLPPETRAALSGLTSATVIGGPGAVSTAVLEEVRSVTGNADRIAGNSRFETSYAVALAAEAAGMSASSTWVATGLNFPDALAAGPAVAKEGGILLLVHGTDYTRSPRVGQWLRERAARVESVTITGGTGAVSAAVESGIRTDTNR